jgi:diguanylate cyclase (GGDEF)-like protein
VPDTDGRALLTYFWSVTLLALPVVVISALQARGDAGTIVRHQGVVLLLMVIVIVGELWPIPVARGEADGDEITVSSTFGFALLILAPVFWAIAAQAIALALDNVIRRRRWHRLPFNIAQYALAFVAARAAYAWAAGQSFDTHYLSDAPQLVPALLAGPVFLVINNSLVGVAVAMKLKARVWRVITQDLKWQVATSAPLLGLGPVVAQAAIWTPLSLVLLLAPIAALHRTGTMAMRREQEALRDGLTGLANRSLLMTSTERALQSSIKNVAMLLIDLDHFKEINDTLGHAVGDRLLRNVATRLSESVRDTDLVARLGGDEFAVLARTVTDLDEARALAGRLTAAMQTAFDLEDIRLDVGCSIGIAVAPLHAVDVEDLLRCADVALYTAKVLRGTYAVYDKAHDRHSVALLGLQSELRAALEDPNDEQISVAYQPQLDLHSGRVVSVECLARWHHPMLGAVPPDMFIPVAESTTLVEALTRRILHSVLSELVRWDGSGLHLDAAVNISARLLADSTLPETIRDLLAEYGIVPGRLVLEVTESRLMTDPERSAAIVRRINDLGVQVSIDDFGTGYSSLAYLQRLAVQELKIDRTFTLGLLANASNDAIVRSTIELGHNLGLRIVAEGVEDVETAERLRTMGCDRLQGYLLGRPVPATELPGVVAAVPQLPSAVPAPRAALAQPATLANGPVPLEPR